MIRDNSEYAHRRSKKTSSAQDYSERKVVLGATKSWQEKKGLHRNRQLSEIGTM